MSFVRSSKFRHIKGTELKNNYTGITLTKKANEAQFCAVNPKFVAMVVHGAGGGPFLVLPLEKVLQFTCLCACLSKLQGVPQKMTPFEMQISPKIITRNQ